MNNGNGSEVDHAARERRGPGIYLLPNLLTTGGIFAGFFSIVAAIDGNFETAAWATIVAVLLDGMDGRVARLTNTESDFGKEYDSLADMVSFGVAPAIITYQWGVVRLAEYGVVWGRLGWLATFLYAVAAAFRLARFNTTTEKIDKRYFEGVPSPPAAGAVVSMVWLASTYELSGLVGLVAGICVTAVVGILMVSRFRYRSFKRVSLSRRVKFANLLLIPLALILISLAPPIVIFALTITYVSSGPFSWFVHRQRRRRPGREPVSGDEDDAEVHDDSDLLSGLLGSSNGSTRRAPRPPHAGEELGRGDDDE